MRTGSIATALLASGLLLLMAGSGHTQSPLKEVASPGAHHAQDGPFRSDEAQVTLAPRGDASGRDQIEFMVEMKAGETLVYSWTVQGSPALWHEMHGHTAEAVTFYKKAEGTAHHGSMTAPFDGPHGWYFENRSSAPVTVSIRLAGFYIPPAG